MSGSGSHRDSRGSQGTGEVNESELAHRLGLIQIVNIVSQNYLTTEQVLLIPGKSGIL